MDLLTALVAGFTIDFVAALEVALGSVLVGAFDGVLAEVVIECL